MFDAIIGFFKFLVDLFRSLPEEDQKKIADAVVRQFEEVFRGFYRQSTGV